MTTWTAGTRLGPHEITARLGEGGKGGVPRARAKGLEGALDLVRRPH
jgi:hypothetical protein